MLIEFTVSQRHFIPSSCAHCLASVLMLAFASFSYTHTFAQGAEVPMATLSGEGIIELPGNEPLSSNYLVDLSEMDFSSSEEMVEYFSARSNQQFLFRALPERGQVVVVLRTNTQPSWTLEEWNASLRALCEGTPIKN